MVSVGVDFGTGKAYCRLCGKQITKKQLCIYIDAYNVSARIHRDKKDCFE